VRATIVPVEWGEVRRFVVLYHRHSDPPISHKFSIGLRDDATGELIGVAIAGRPVSRHLDDGMTIELTRVTTTGERNACSRLYGAACRAAFAIGYRRVITYTLASESGSSLRGAGFEIDHAYADATRIGWNRSSRPRGAQTRMFYPARSEDEEDVARVRWIRVA
jgi:hypothetical protein